MGLLTPRREGGKTAVVVSREVDYGFARRLQTVSGLHDYPVFNRICRTVDEAMKWLDEAEMEG